MRAHIAAALSAFVIGLALPAIAAPNGTSCAQVSDCDSGICVDGVCCDRACDATCESCLAAEKANGLDTGTCGPVRAGTDPADECAPEAMTTCGRTGQCDGLQAACARWPLGTACHDPADTKCFGDHQVTGFICSGRGACYAEPTFVDCAGRYKCELPDGGTPSTVATPGQCAIPCASDGDCLLNYHCHGGACVSGLPVKASCQSDADCAPRGVGNPGHCADGVCCDTACGGQCEACDLPGLVGTCSQVTSGQPVLPRKACTGLPPCQGACHATRDGCEYPGASTECGADGGSSAACVNHSVKHADTCDTKGGCRVGSTENCRDFSCDPIKLECFTECTTSKDCAGGPCDTSSGKGVCQPAAAACADQWSSRDTSGLVTPCPGGYGCIGEGQCLSKCSGPADCNSAAGYVCNAKQRCVLALDAGAVVHDANAPTGAGGDGSGGSRTTSSGGAVGAGGQANLSGSADASTVRPTSSRDSGGCGCRAARKDRESEPALAVALVALAVSRRRKRVVDPGEA